MAQRKKPLVVVTRKLPDSIETRMRELFDTQLNLDDKPMTAAQLADTVKSADVLVPTVTDRIDASVLSKAGDKLKLIANYGNGVDHIDVATALSRGITVTNTPGVLTEDTADMTMALILAVPRRLAEGAAVLSEDKPWPGWSPTWMLGHRIWGKRLGAAPAPSGCKSITTIGVAFRPRSRRSSPLLIGRVSTRCSPAWTSSPSIVRTRRRRFICCRPEGSSSSAPRLTSSTPRAAR